MGSRCQEKERGRPVGIRHLSERTPDHPGRVADRRPTDRAIVGARPSQRRRPPRRPALCQQDGLGYHRLALYLLGPGAAEATVTQIEPGPVGAADLVVSHAMSVLAAGGVERVVGRIPYQSAWRHQRQWHWDPDERAYNVAHLRAARHLASRASRRSAHL